MRNEAVARELLEAVRDYVLGHADPLVARFRDSIRDWGSEYRPADPARFAAADSLAIAEIDADSPGSELLALFQRHNPELRWEQSYRREDKLVPDRMLDTSAFAEILGSRGPFVSDRIRSGIGVYGREVHYPRHWHQAEEVYLPLSGSARFHIDGETVERGPGDVVFVASDTPHGFTVNPDRALIVFYLWQAGDLRQTSSFG